GQRFTGTRLPSRGGVRPARPAPRGARCRPGRPGGGGGSGQGGRGGLSWKRQRTRGAARLVRPVRPPERRPDRGKVGNPRAPLQLQGRRVRPEPSSERAGGWVGGAGGGRQRGSAAGARGPLGAALPVDPDGGRSPLRSLRGP